LCRLDANSGAGSCIQSHAYITPRIRFVIQPITHVYLFFMDQKSLEVASTGAEAVERVTVVLPRSLRQNLERLARENDRSVSGEARRALAAHVTQEVRAR
jgi:hypothetical protein